MRCSNKQWPAFVLRPFWRPMNMKVHPSMLARPHAMVKVQVHCGIDKRACLCVAALLVADEHESAPRHAGQAAHKGCRWCCTDVQLQVQHLPSCCGFSGGS